jgi:hypothetical protein
MHKLYILFVNTGVKKKLSSNFLGVSWNAEKKKWVASTTIMKKIVFFGRYDDETDAARAYDNAVKGFSNKRLNFRKLDIEILISLIYQRDKTSIAPPPTHTSQQQQLEQHK